MLNRYVHPAQGGMDRAMEWYAKAKSAGPQALQDMLIEFQTETSKNTHSRVVRTTLGLKCGPNSPYSGALLLEKNGCGR